MNSNLKKEKGFLDVFPNDEQFSSVRKIIFSFFEKRNYKEIITPIVEKKELFERVFVAGDSVVNREMFIFKNKKGVELVLRPEVTGSVMRAVIESGYYQLHRKPIKLFYFGKMFRYERPQKNRQREFHQFGIEIIGEKMFYSDVEMIITAYDLICLLKVNRSLKLLINYFGSKKTKEKYILALKCFLKKKIIAYCEDCLVRYQNNTLRIFDCIKCKKKILDFPKISFFWTPEEKKTYEKIKNLLEEAKIPFEEDEMLVRGIDYYTGVVFEIVDFKNQNQQNTVIGGGRYDELALELFSKKIPAVGWALGFERLLSKIRVEKKSEKNNSMISVIFTKPELQDIAYLLSVKLQRERISGVEFTSYSKISFRKQFNNALARGSKFIIIVGEKEQLIGKFTLRNCVLETEKTLGFKELVSELRHEKHG